MKKRHTHGSKSGHLPQTSYWLVSRISLSTLPMYGLMGQHSSRSCDILADCSAVNDWLSWSYIRTN
jgi:hypothetical protein